MSRKYQEKAIVEYQDGYHEIPSSSAISMKIEVPKGGAFKASFERSYMTNDFTMLVWFSRTPFGNPREPQLGTSKRHVCNNVELLVARDFTHTEKYGIAALDDTTGSGAVYLNVQNNYGGPNSFEIEEM